MSIARRIGVALTLAGSLAPLAAATSQRTSPGYTYRLDMTGRVSEPNGRTTDFVVMSGHALVTDKAGRLDIDRASLDRGAVAQKDSYILYDSTSMTIVSPTSRQIVRLPLEHLERALSAARASDAGVEVSDPSVNLEQLGPGEPILGMATTKYRITQDYKVATKGASTTRNSTERIVQDFWMADAPKHFANPFARLRHLGASPNGGYRDVAAAATADRVKDHGIALKTVTTISSTSSRNEVTQTVSTMQVTELQTENIDDDILVAPTDYQAVALSDLARTAPSARGAQVGQPAKVARPAASDNAAAEAKGEFVKTLHGMGRRP
jgi:hypothetical protein